MKRTAIVLLFFSLLCADKQPRHHTRDRDVDIHHIRIDVRLDFISDQVSGNVIHTLSPLSSSLSHIDMDAEDMVIRRVRLNGKDIPFFQSEDQVHMDLRRSYGWTDTLDLTMNYTATPRTGLYFFKPDSTYPDRRTQAWTQGEETDNHHWVPLYDYPNDRATFETILTVDQRFKAISNGELVSYRENDNNTHTFHWRENFPMVSYLISFAVGEYVKVEDPLGDLPINYWVYPENQNEAHRSFGKTPDMMKYFNNVTGIEYPFEKYDQVIVADFMFGGMENITLTHNTDRTMHDARAVPDHSSVGLVAHELAHQWYGNMITTRNWANIWLNEGFATFFSRLYRAHDLGSDNGDYIRLNEIRAYQGNDKRNRRPTVHYEYSVPMQLFDSHVYAKGSLILNMLRDVLGEEGFWRSIRHYTRENRMKNVETTDLKKAIEEITGKNLDWFFKQWVYEPGYPEYDVSWSYNQRTQNLRLHVLQTQDRKKTDLFKMPVQILIDNGETSEHTIWVEDADTVFDLPCSFRPKMVIFNTGMRIPCKLKMRKSVADLKYQLQNASNIIDRIWAAHELSGKKGRKVVEYMLLDAAKTDPFWGVRKEAAIAFGKLKPKIKFDDYVWINNEHDSRVKRALIGALRNYKGDTGVSSFLQSVIRADTNYYVIADAFKTLVSVDSSSAKQYVEGLLNTESHNDTIRKSALVYFSTVKTDKNYERLQTLGSYGGMTWESRPSAIKELGAYVKTRPETVELLIDFLNDQDRFVRREAINQLGKYGNRSHFAVLDSVKELDPVLAVNVLSAKKAIRLRSTKKDTKKEKNIDELRQIVDDIQQILDK